MVASICHGKLMASLGGPQMRGAVMRIAPKPRRWTSMSPPILNEPDLRASSLALIAHLVDWR
jgi:hypothetical protein